MKRIVLSIICFFLTLFANAQVPVFEWAKGISSADKITVNNGKSVAVDAAGNTYTTGDFVGTVDFDPGPAVVNITSHSASNSDFFILKLNASGNFMWVKNVGVATAGYAAGYSITVDASGNVFTTGSFNGTMDFDPGAGTAMLTSDSTSSLFILKLNSSGNYTWARNMVRSTAGSFSAGYSIALDAGGNIYTTGDYYGTVDFDPGAGVADLTSTGSQDIFVSKLDSFGNYVWAKGIGGNSGAVINANSITSDGSGNIYTTGYFSGTVDFDPAGGIYNLSSTGFYDAMFISKLDVSGNFVWAKYFGGTGSTDNVVGYSIVADTANNIYSTGYFYGTIDFDPGVAVANLVSPSDDIFISKLDASGNYVWTRMMSETSGDMSTAVSIVLDDLTNVYITGNFQGSVDFDPGPGTMNLISSGTQDAFISKFDASGNYVWAKNMGGVSSVTEGASIGLDAADNVYTIGYLQGTADFDPDAGVYNITSSGTNDIYLHKLSQPSNGISEYGNDNYISIYPNPSNGIFNVVVSSPTKNTTIEIYNSIGELVYNKQNINAQTEIELSNQANGLYFVKVMNEDKIIGMKKIIKE